MDGGRQVAAVSEQLRGNQPLCLGDPDAIWIVESGSLAVATARLSAGQIAGPRRHQFTVTTGQVLLGVEEASGDALQLLAVALEPVELRRYSLGELRAAGQSVDVWVEEWRERWIAAGLLEAASAETGLPGLQAQLVEALARQAGERERADRSRLAARSRSARRIADEAVTELASVVARGARGLPRGTPLFVAAAAVGRAQGLELEPAPESGHGSVTEQVELLARASRIRSRRVLLEGAWWEAEAGPLLAFRGETREPVALLPWRGGYRALDPTTGKATHIDDEAAAAIDPEAFVFYRPLPERATSAWELFRFAMAGRSRDMLTLLGAGVMATLLGMFTPQATALLVDRAIPDGEVGLVRQLALGLVAAALGAGIFRVSQAIALMRIETAADAATQAAVWDRLLNLRLSFFREFSSGDLQSRVSAVGQIRNYLGGTTLRSLFSSAILLLNLLLLLYYSPLLTMVAAASAGLSATVAILSGLAILRYSRQILELRGRFFGLMVQLINGVPKLRVAAAEERAFARWASDFARLLRLELAEQRIQDWVQATNIAIAALGTVALFALAGPVVAAGELSTGHFLAFYVAYGIFVGATVSLSNTVTDVLAIAILRERARPILEAVPEVDPHKAAPGRLRGAVSVENVTFRYREDGPAILDGVTLRAEAGEFVAVVGPSGSGKSTLFRLVLGFETPASGSVYIDGQELSGLDGPSVRRQMGVVLQNGRISAGSIFENIAAGAHVSLDDAWEAARATGFADEVEAMPMGMHTVISEGGTNLSGGQRQRMLLARALVHRPRILLLDEATSALDNTTQAIVSRSLESLNVTRLVVAHRLSTIRNADRICVVEAGRIVQEGSFEELAGAPGLFARLMARQQT